MEFKNFFYFIRPKYRKKTFWGFQHLIISETFKPKVVKSNQPSRAPVAMSDQQLIEGTCNNYHPAGDFDCQTSIGIFNRQIHITRSVTNIAKLANNGRHFKCSGCKIGFWILGIQSSNNGKCRFRSAAWSLTYAFNYNTIYSDKWFTCYKSWL